VNQQQHMEPPPSAAARIAALTDASGPATVREVFRAKHRLAVSVMERTQHYGVAYSLADIHRLTFLSHEERSGVETEWHAWHRKYVRLGKSGVAFWLAGLVVAWGFWFRSESIVAALARTGVTLPPIWSTGLAAMTTLALILSLPAFLATMCVAATRDSYLRGYSDGLTRGVNRALRITPELEAEMWEELREAERVDAALAGSAGSVSAIGSEGLQGS
jgi:hypothetical protein